jgi:CubicO group peptidase (beta-lactamase class C family)
MRTCVCRFAILAAVVTAASFHPALAEPPTPAGAPPSPPAAVSARAPESPAGQPPLSQAEALQAIDREVSESAAADTFSGVVVVAQSEGKVYERAVGFADQAAKLPNRVDTKFNLGSINKLFTKLAIAHLAQEGKLKLDDRLIQHLPDYPNRAVAEQITLRQILDHRSGLGDIFGPRFEKAPHDLRTLKDFLALFADQPLLFPPGTKEQYSNAGYIVLGLVVERLSGKSYYDAVKEWILTPAGMTDTDAYAFDAAVPNRAVGYTRPDFDGPQNPGKEMRHSNTGSLPGRGSSAGGGFSTAPDLLRFAQALRADKLLSFAWTDWVLGGPEPGAGSAARPNAAHHGGLGIAGGAPGINAALEIDLDHDRTVIVLGNYDPPNAMAMARRVRQILARVR